MTMKWFAAVLVAVLLAGSPAQRAGAATPPVPPEPAVAPTAPLPDRAELEEDLERARVELDAAAARLAELHRELYAVETVGQSGQKPMLGVLLGERGPNSGLLLVGVTPGSGAEAAGLRAGDELVGVNGVDLTGADKALHALKEAMTSVAPGDVVPVTFNRDGGVLVADVTTQARGVYFMGMTGMPGVDVERMGAMAAGAVDFSADAQWIESVDALENLESLEHLQALGDGPTFFHRAVRIGGPGGGLRLEDISADLGRYFGVEAGVLVMDAPPAEEGRPSLKAGDILLVVDGTAIGTAGEGYQALFAAPQAGEQAQARTVEVLRDGVRESLSLPSGYPAGDAHGITIRKGDAGNLDVRVIRRGPS